jgi:AcrR family transcriptional regulator
MGSKGAVSNARQRVREAIRADIVASARDQLAVDGAGALSLRAVARDLGMASSAMYRYFPSRDDLLTALIIEAYDALGEAAESAAARGGHTFSRWQAVCRSVREWAVEHPHEYTLIYGSPVPGYLAPAETIGPASRVTLVLARLLVDAQEAGELVPVDDPPLPRAMAAEARQLAQLAMPGVPLPAVAKGLVAWTQLFGQVNFELFGQLHGIVGDPEAFFDFAISTMARLVGIHPVRKTTRDSTRRLADDQGSG